MLKSCENEKTGNYELNAIPKQMTEIMNLSTQEDSTSMDNNRQNQNPVRATSNQVYLATEESTVRVLNHKSQKLIKIVTNVVPSNDFVTNLSTTTNNKYLYVCGGMGNLRQYDTRTLKLIQDFGKIDEIIDCMVISQDNRTILFASNGVLKQFDLDRKTLTSQ